jgi:hypothetical protein
VLRHRTRNRRGSGLEIASMRSNLVRGRPDSSSRPRTYNTVIHWGYNWEIINWGLELNATRCSAHGHLWGPGPSWRRSRHMGRGRGDALLKYGNNVIMCTRGCGRLPAGSTNARQAGPHHCRRRSLAAKLMKVGYCLEHPIQSTMSRQPQHYTTLDGDLSHFKTHRHEAQNKEQTGYLYIKTAAVAPPRNRKTARSTLGSSTSWIEGPLGRSYKQLVWSVVNRACKGCEHEALRFSTTLFHKLSTGLLLGCRQHVMTRLCKRMVFLAGGPLRYLCWTVCLSCAAPPADEAGAGAGLSGWGL